jgi:hypothetical protein
MKLTAEDNLLHFHNVNNCIKSFVTCKFCNYQFKPSDVSLYYVGFLILYQIDNGKIINIQVRQVKFSILPNNKKFEYYCNEIYGVLSVTEILDKSERQVVFKNKLNKIYSLNF